MRVGIDSDSYHRLHGEFRSGEELPGPRWALEPTPVLLHARGL